jgi:hypothetical protein
MLSKCQYDSSYKRSKWYQGPQAPITAFFDGVGCRCRCVGAEEAEVLAERACPPKVRGQGSKHPHNSLGCRILHQQYDFDPDHVRRIMRRAVHGDLTRSETYN